MTKEKPDKRNKRRDSKKAVLIYDGNCPVCKKTVRWIEENALEGVFEMLPCQSREVKGRFPFIEEAVCMQAMQLVLPDGTVLSGEKAIPEILKRLRKYDSAAELFKLPGSEKIARSFYRWFADRRYHVASILFPNESRKNEQELSSSNDR
jgi:predicted DCC family thiol-disulfide oxidoreductase YuxK